MTEPAASTTGAQALLAALKRHGVDHVFGIPGVHTLPLYDALHAEPGIRTVVVRHENGASCAADAFARVSGRTSVCTAVPGPGATNLATGVLTAYGDSTPMVVITSQIPARVRGRAAVHDCDLETLYRPLVKGCVVVERPDEVEQGVERAFALARSGRPGPVQLLMSIEALGPLTGEPSVRQPAPTPGAATPDGNRRSDVEDAARRLNAARNPVFVVGDGVVAAGATGLVRELVARCGAVVFSSHKGRGAFPESHPRSFGLMSWSGAREVLETADLCLALATRFSEISTLNWGVPMPAELIRVDLEPAELHVNYPASLAVLAEVRSFLEALLPLVEPRGSTPLTRRVAALRAERDAELERFLTSSQASPVHPLYVSAALRRAFPDETVFTTDGTTTQFWLSEPAMEINRPRTLLIPEVSQTMGFGLAAAIGARLAAPDRPVVCVTGDGSLTMGLSELVTAAGLGINLPVVVFDDGYYNALRIYQDGLFGGRRMGVELNNPDFVKLAEAVGARGLRVERPEALEASLVEAREAPGVTLVDVAIDHRPMPTRYANRVRAMTSLENF